MLNVYFHRYTEFQGYSDENETRIGVSYARLCQSVRPGNRILIADGTIVIEVHSVVCLYNTHNGVHTCIILAVICHHFHHHQQQ